MTSVLVGRIKIVYANSVFGGYLGPRYMGTSGLTITQIKAEAIIVSFQRYEGALFRGTLVVSDLNVRVSFCRTIHQLDRLRENTRTLRLPPSEACKLL